MTLDCPNSECIIHVYLDDFMVIARSVEELISLLLEFLIFLMEESDDFFISGTWP
jgi:hypothetical protein